jgi:hypothetical protein
MEPEPVDSFAEDRKLAALLREQMPPLPPRAFAAQVMAALPPSRPAGIHPRRIVLCLLGAAIGLAFAWQRSGWEFSPDFVRQAAQALAEPRLLGALVLTLGSLAFAFWRGPRTPHSQ